VFITDTPLLPQPHFSAADFAGARELILRKGETLFRQGDGHKGECYLLLEGEMAVKLDTPSGGELLLYRLRAGELVGELGALGNMERTAAVVANGRCRLLAISSSLLQQMMENDSFLHRLLSLTLTRYYRSHLVIQRLGIGSITRRLCQYLDTLVREQGESQRFFQLPSFAELASAINCRRESISRVMHQLVDKGVLAAEEGGQYRIHRGRLADILRDGE